MHKRIFGILLVAYCGFVGAATSITNRTWVFDTLNGVAVNTSKYQDQKSSIIFHANGRFSAYAGCNRIAGSYTISGQELVFARNTIMTRMACPGNVTLENSFIAILPQVRHWAVENSVLTLSASEGVALMTLKLGTSE